MKTTQSMEERTKKKKHTQNTKSGEGKVNPFRMPINMMCAFVAIHSFIRWVFHVEWTRKHKELQHNFFDKCWWEPLMLLTPSDISLYICHLPMQLPPFSFFFSLLVVDELLQFERAKLRNNIQTHPFVIFVFWFLKVIGCLSWYVHILTYCKWNWCCTPFNSFLTQQFAFQFRIWLW